MPEYQGIPKLFDLTHVADLQLLGKLGLDYYLMLIVLAGLFGIVLASLSRSEIARPYINEWTNSYGSWLKMLQHGGAALIVVVTSFVLCSTLANRYHNWEQGRLHRTAQTVEGLRLEQGAPTVRYITNEPFTSVVYRDGKPTDVKGERPISHYANLQSSTIEVNIDQFVKDPKTDHKGYKIAFQADYAFKNALSDTTTFFFDAYVPRNYDLLQDFQVEQSGAQLQAERVNERSYKFQLAPGETTRFTVKYQAQGDARWVYDANRVILSDFKLAINTHFPNAQFASGIPPTSTEAISGGTSFTWEFRNNVSVQNPFGVFTGASAPIFRKEHTGVIPRLLILMPGIFLWWLLLLSLSLQITPRGIVVFGVVAFASILALTYLSRLMDPLLAWGLLNLLMLGSGRLLLQSESRTVVMTALIGFSLPVLAMLVPYTGLTLSVAALAAVLWLVIVRRGCNGLAGLDLIEHKDAAVV